MKLLLRFPIMSKLMSNPPARVSKKCQIVFMICTCAVRLHTDRNGHSAQKFR